MRQIIFSPYVIDATDLYMESVVTTQASRGGGINILRSKQLNTGPQVERKKTAYSKALLPHLIFRAL